MPRNGSVIARGIFTNPDVQSPAILQAINALVAAQVIVAFYWEFVGDKDKGWVHRSVCPLPNTISH